MLSSETLIGELQHSLAKQELETQVRSLLQLLQQASELESAYLTRIDLHHDKQHVLYALNAGDLCIPEGLAVDWQDSLCKRALAEQQFCVADISSCWGDSGAARELGIRSYLSTPVTLSDGQIYGTICGASKCQVEVSAASITLLQLMARIIAMQVEREQLLQVLEQENRLFRSVALTDPLTGLANRRALHAELQRALANSNRNGTTIFVAYIDLDNFKQINDNFGHDAGDRFLLAITAALLAGRREGDFTARIGGDEFVVVGYLIGDDLAQARDSLYQQLLSCTSGQFDIGEQLLSYGGASIGLVLAKPEDNTEQLLKRADAEMYAQKRQRKKAITAVSLVN